MTGCAMTKNREWWRGGWGGGGHWRKLNSFDRHCFIIIQVENWHSCDAHRQHTNANAVLHTSLSFSHRTTELWNRVEERKKRIVSSLKGEQTTDNAVRSVFQREWKHASSLVVVVFFSRRFIVRWRWVTLSQPQRQQQLIHLYFMVDSNSHLDFRSAVTDMTIPPAQERWCKTEILKGWMNWMQWIFEGHRCEAPHRSRGVEKL